MTRLKQSRTYQKIPDPTQEGTHEKPNQARTCQEGTGEKRPEQYRPKLIDQNKPAEQYRPKLIDQNKPARTDQTKLKRTAWTRADLNRTMNQTNANKKG